MSWFKETLVTYDVLETPLTEEDKANPFIQNVFEEDFVKVPIVNRNAKPITVEAVENGSTNKLTDISG